MIRRPVTEAEQIIAEEKLRLFMETRAIGHAADAIAALAVLTGNVFEDEQKPNG